MSKIASVQFDSGKLRHGNGKNTDKDGDPIVSRGFIVGDSEYPIVPTTHTDVETNRYKITITATQDGHNKTWKGRIISAVFDGQIFTHWIFVVVNTANISREGPISQTELAVNVVVTNPDGSPSNPYPTTVPATTIP
jgi:hypothetical protein